MVAPILRAFRRAERGRCVIRRLRPPTLAFRLNVNVRLTRLLPVSVLGLLAALATLDLRAERPETPPRVLVRAAGEGDLLAGAGRAKVELPADVPLGGYRFFGRMPTEGAGPLFARSLLLEAGGVRTAIVLVELMTLPPTLAAAAQERARAEGAACALVVATHTHSGPGGYDPAFLPQMAIGRYDPAVEEALLQAISSSLATARAELAPAQLATGEAQVAGLVSNRDRKRQQVDDRLTAAAITRPDGARVATLARFSAHPTLNPKRIGPAGDWPGFAMERLEEAGGVAFVLPGAAGDARPTRKASPGKGAVRALLFAESVAEELREVPLVPAVPPLRLGCAEVAFALPAADLAGMVPPGLGTLASNVAAPSAPPEAHAIAFRLDDLVLLGLPAEPMARSAPALEARAERAGLQGRVVGLAQGYVSYGVGPEEMQARSVSARNAWFGDALAPRLETAAAAATDALLGPPVQAAR